MKTPRVQMGGKTPPDRLCSERQSRFYNRSLLDKVMVTLDGRDVTPVCVEYCVSGRWVRCNLIGLDGKPQRGAVPGVWRIIQRSGAVAVTWIGNKKPPTQAPAVSEADPGV